MKNKKDFRIHFVGIKGVGMTALALLVKGAGLPVTGSDQPGVFITSIPLKKAGIVIYETFSEEHVKNAKLVITTGAHGGFGNPEVVTAKANGITVWTFGEAVGKFMDGTLISMKPYVGISITGTHGKTTTTAMVATLFSELKLDPSYIIGTSSIPSLPDGMPGRFGKGEYFIAEADEYVAEPLSDKTPKMLYQHPKIAVITSIELDHPDVFAGIEDVVQAFSSFIEAIPTDGVLIACGDTENLRGILTRATCNVKTYGFSPQNDFVITRVFISGNQTFFWVKGMGTDLGEFHINVPGEHNALNALASILVALEAGQDVTKIKFALLAFTGSKRRMEFVGSMKSGALLYDDYAHHPSEIIATLKAFRQMYPRSRIVCVFQPHTYSRTKKLFDQFLHSFSEADEVILLDIFSSAREKRDESISSRHLQQGMERTHKLVTYAASIEGAAKKLLSDLRTDRDVIVTMGAGDVYTLHQYLNGK